MGSLYRRVEKIDFDGEEIAVREIDVAVLTAAELGQIVLDGPTLLNACTGLDIEDLSPAAYKKIMEVIDEMHKEYFVDDEDGKKASKKK